ncbi:MAG: hypothetical protein MUE49_01250 [Rhodospirillales bacterium]|nr:hypothetical protein [Rhodospirillales bacterium]
MTTPRSRQFRDARDRIIDLLGFGETYPLRDLPVRDERLTVSFGATATIPIETTQRGVEYGLRTKQGESVGTALVSDGDTLLLASPRIVEDITFTVRARKPTGRTADLFETATVKVGLDIGLAAAFRPPVPQPPIVAFGAAVEVEIASSQEGVDYRLVHFPNGEPANPESMPQAANDVILSENQATVRGTGATIVLRSRPMTEDTVIAIRAIKIFDAADARPPQTNILKVRLPLGVAANPGLALAVSPAPIVPFQGDATVRIPATQASAHYQAFARRIFDHEFRHGTPAGTPGTLRVRVDGEDDVIIAAPERPEDGSDLAGWKPLADAQAGTGGDLAMTLPAATDDSLVLVRASKRHAVADGEAVPSAVWLSATAAVLVQPNPKPRLRLLAVIEGDRTTGALGIDGGQPGVFYAPQLLPARSQPFPLPAYQHKRDETDARLNKGVGQLKLGVDFVIATDPAAEAVTGPPAETPPAVPIIVGDPLAVGSRLGFAAIKAQTRVGASLTTEAEILAAPKVRLDAAIIDHGTEARAIISDSRADETYALIIGNKTVVPAAAGNGAELVLRSGRLQQDAVLVVASVRDTGATAIERRVTLAVTVRPNPALTVRAVNAAVAKDGETAIVVERSERGVDYQLLTGDTKVGEPIAGSGRSITLPTGPIAADTTFTIRATKTAVPAASIILASPVTVTVIVVDG